MDDAPSGNTARKLVFLIGALYLFFLLLIGFTASDLPARVASHFNYSGVPDGWMSRDSYLLLTSLVAVFLSAFPAISFYSLRWLPPHWLRLPAGWMTPERRDRTLQELFIFGLGASLILLLIQISLHSAVLIANQANPPHLAKWLSSLPLGIFTIGFVPWFLRISRYFKKAPNPEPE